MPLMIAGNIPGKTQTIPTAIYFAVESKQRTRKQVGDNNDGV